MRPATRSAGASPAERPPQQAYDPMATSSSRRRGLVVRTGAARHAGRPAHALASKAASHGSQWTALPLRAGRSVDDIGRRRRG